jgi:hypothetical protein
MKKQGFSLDEMFWQCAWQLLISWGKIGRLEAVGRIHKIQYSVLYCISKDEKSQ